MPSLLELAANGVITASIILAGRNSLHTWWSGILGCALFAIVFAQAQLYADVLLQVFFVATSAWGWREWLRGDAGEPRPVSRTSGQQLGWIGFAALVATAGYGAALHAFTDAFAPFVDSAVLAFSVAAQFLLMMRRIESWTIWLIVNTLAVPLYASRGLYLTSALYAAYWLNAFFAWRHWRRLLKGEA